MRYAREPDAITAALRVIKMHFNVVVVFNVNLATIFM